MAEAKQEIKETPHDESDRVNKILDFEIHLTNGECEKIGDAVEKLINSIFKREKDPIKRRLLLKQIDAELNYQVSRKSSAKVHQILNKQKKEKTVKQETSKTEAG